MYQIICSLVLVFILPFFSSSDIAISADSFKPEVGNHVNEEFGPGCSLRCAARWDLRTSSMRKPQGNVNYDINNIDDGNLNTAWMPANGGIGESVSFVFNQVAGMESTTFWGFEIVNGYQTMWQENARAKKIRIEHNGKPLYEVHLHEMEVQSVRFNPFTIRPGSEVKLVILETYPGRQSQDLVIAELIPHGAH